MSCQLTQMQKLQRNQVGSVGGRDLDTKSWDGGGGGGVEL